MNFSPMHYPTRTAEWVTACVLMAFAFILTLPGDTLKISDSFNAFVQLGVEETMLAVPMAMVSSLRMAGLYINGRWRKSPMLRMVGAIFGATIFSLLTISFIYPYVVLSIPASTAIGTYGVLCVADVFAAYRAGKDYGEMNPQSFIKPWGRHARMDTN